jgi:hypothetical protein
MGHMARINLKMKQIVLGLNFYFFFFEGAGVEVSRVEEGSRVGQEQEAQT